MSNRVNVKVVCRSGAVLLASRTKQSEAWQFRQPGMLPVPLAKSKTQVNVLDILTALAESDFGGVRDREIFEEKPETVRKLRGGLDP